jgi:prolipoprotein diacylglyceryl transferase
MDMIAPGVMLAQAMGRWGNFFNGEAHGGIVSEGSPLYFMRMGLYPNDVVYGEMAYVHPTFLYESLWNLLGFALINLLIYPRKKFNGQVAMTYFAWYGFGRMLIEGLRTDSLYLGNSNIRVSQLVAALCFVVFTALIVINLDRARKLARQEAGDTYVPVFTPHAKAASDENALCAAEQQTDAEQEKTDDSAESPTNNE